MLAKDVKIRNLKRQREFIRKQLSPTEPRKDGNPAYRYAGHIYPEVIKYFEDEGYVITEVHSDMLTAAANGLPVYLFIPKDIKLSEEEMKQAEAYASEDEEAKAEEQLMDYMLDAILSGRGWYANFNYISKVVVGSV